MIKSKHLLVFVAVPFLFGCASITGTTQQSVSVQTYEKGGKEVVEAKCDLSNSKGRWFVTTPGSTGITRSNDDLTVVCRKETHETGTGKIVSVTKGAMFGNILFGGGIGALIDHNSGAAYEYPAIFSIVMGDAVINPLVQNVPSTITGKENILASATAENASDNSASALRKLEQLKIMKDRGMISQDEFDGKKKEILTGL